MFDIPTGADAAAPPIKSFRCVCVCVCLVSHTMSQHDRGSDCSSSQLPPSPPPLSVCSPSALISKHGGVFPASPSVAPLIPRPPLWQLCSYILFFTSSPLTPRSPCALMLRYICICPKAVNELLCHFSTGVSGVIQENPPHPPSFPSIQFLPHHPHQHPCKLHIIIFKITDHFIQIKCIFRR